MTDPQRERQDLLVVEGVNHPMAYGSPVTISNLLKLWLFDPTNQLVGVTHV